ncbi:5-(carboxyamino)imidazole ribonucleotide synthase [Flavobacteriaceae bacterium]|uniref:5-(carboxyamino)imidazole ribonucleotide synthase n=1 Tax=Candidatus Arcticimaribacter forsetii TaxID=2820661 RepID=UPI002077082A|nr:5-(carboxyamino)imidazole ribonucleotide synthase [Candidatus Arcticimaribacter forsetii]MDA8639451.1 5-(carboxyamino)imidazole ribonucleotide synthase [Flavobacteriaceae bacterium]MDA8698786.1 5-(carboxyamino)imidazole ribonucleotide synthase [Flavobacteriaceae bacterium]MDB2325797.1 5-(carboxyamino)imidazole ribonucleotide synthase [Flavobacteriaceae bacterium]MDB2329459.1 5-(carboxyamino)imidazole ribonucleotide synthase [Flavobacteriaceae bacterium]MDB2345949.1 5-(carboxyamino)imidazole
MSFFSTHKTLGILGGGQLGKMLLYTTRKWDIKTSVLDPSEEAPCKIACDYFEVGDFKDYDTVYQFGKKVDVLTFEIEHVNLEALKQLEKEGVHVYPSAATLEVIQNKSTQKDFYKNNNIPTAPHQNFDDVNQLKEAIKNKELNLPFVWKSALMGYDGNGVSIIKNTKQLESLPNVACLAELLVPFTHELGVIVCRNPSGEVVAYPTVEMEFHPEANQVEYVLCPSRLDKTITDKAQKVALQVSRSFEHVGLLAVELFLTKTGDILVNEVAPRPHNSGHVTIETAYTDQFEQHIRAILDLPLGNPENKVSGVMVNLVGAENHSGAVHYENMNTILNMPGVIPHIYGKKDTRPFRKMGHVTIVNENLNEARKIAEVVKKTIHVISK